MSTFWDGVFGNSPVIQPTPGELLPPPENTPYDNLLGGYVGLDSSINDAGADAVFPPLSPDPNSPDSLTARAGKPPGFDTPPADLDPSIFASWHTYYQAEYINAHGGGLVTIGKDPTAIHVTLSADQSPTNLKVYILETLQKSDFAAMALADQRTIANTDIFKTKIGPQLGLSGADGADPLATLNKLEDQINDFAKNHPAHFSAADAAVFTGELDNIKRQIAQMGVFSIADINGKVAEIEGRFKRVELFSEAVDSSPTPFTGDRTNSNTEFQNVISTQIGAIDIKNGLDAFMNAERQIAAASNAALELADTGTLHGLTKHLDAPSLVAAFQFASNLVDQAKNAADTEEVNQINDLLASYNAIQALVNKTTGAFGTDTDEKLGLGGVKDVNNDPNNSGGTKVVIDPTTHKPVTMPIDPTRAPISSITSSSDRAAANMFEQDLGQQLNPIEQLLNIHRPQDDLFDNKGGTLNSFDKAHWDAFSANLSNAVQQISQQNQLSFNDINSREKERTTFFTGATSALSKAADISASIGRNIA